MYFFPFYNSIGRFLCIKYSQREVEKQGSYRESHDDEIERRTEKETRL